MTELFISYSRRDKEFVLRFLKALNDNSYSQEQIWVDWEDIPPSSQWEDEIRKGIEETNSVIFILSPEWAKSNECAKELKVAAQYSKRLFPIIWQNVDPNTIQPELAKLNWIFFRETDNFDEAMQKLLAALKTDLEWVAQHTNLLRSANEWVSKGRDAGYLLRGAELQAAETWLSQASKDKQPSPSELQSEFIYASRQDDLRRQRRNLIWVSVTAVVSLMLAVMAVISGISALRQSQKALASQLAAEAGALVDTQPDLSLLLSLEANYINDQLNESDPAVLGSLLTAMNSTPKLETYLRGHTSDVRALAFSSDPEGRWLVTAGGVPTGETGEVILWDLQAEQITSQKLNTGNTARFLAAAFSADNKTFAAAGDGKQLFVWNVDTCCDPIHQIPVEEKVRAIKFVKVNGREYLAAATGNKVTFWDVEKEKMQANLTLTPETFSEDIRVLSLAVSPNGNDFAAGSEDGAVTVWDLKSRKPKFRVCSYGDIVTEEQSPCDSKDSDIKEIRGLAYSSDGTLLVSGSSDQHAWLWDARTGELLAKTPDGNEGGHINTVTGVAFKPNTHQLATVSWDNTVRLWEVVREGNAWSLHRLDTLAGHSNSIWADAFSPNGEWLASVSSDKTVILWNVDRVNQIGAPIAKMKGEVWALAVAPTGNQFAAGDEAGDIRIWNFKDGAFTESSKKMNHPEGVLALAYSHNNKWLASAGYDGTILVWDVQNGTEAWRIKDAHTDEIWALIFSPNDQMLASASLDATAKLWNTSNAQPISALQHNDGVFALAFNKDGTELLVAGWESKIYHWDVTNPASPLNSNLLQGHIYSVNSLSYNLAFPPLLVSTSDDKTLLLWNVDAGESTPPVLGLNESMEAVTFRPSGDWLASATNNSTVLLWQLKPEECSQNWDAKSCQPSRLGAPLVGHQDSVNNVVFLSDLAMVSSSADGQLIYWNLDKSFWYDESCGIVNRPLTESETNQYISGKINVTMLNIFDWFADLFGSSQTETIPWCLG